MRQFELLALAAAFGTAWAACSGDNCLRALRASERSRDSDAFCSGYLEAYPTIAVPSYLSMVSSLPRIPRGLDAPSTFCQVPAPHQPVD